MFHLKRQTIAPRNRNHNLTLTCPTIQIQTHILPLVSILLDEVLGNVPRGICYVSSFSESNPSDDIGTMLAVFTLDERRGLRDGSIKIMNREELVSVKILLFSSGHRSAEACSVLTDGSPEYV